MLMRRRLKQSILLIVWMLSAAIVAYSQPVAGFSTDTVSGCAPLLVRFTDKSTAILLPGNGSLETEPFI
jgi:PKD repeat protein